MPLLSLRLLTQPQATRELPTRRPVVVVTFDDGLLTDYTEAFDYMVSKGVKGTSYIITSRIGESGRLTWAMVGEMLASEMWDVQCHTHTHPNLTEITLEQVAGEMVSVNDSFVNAGFAPPKHMALPFGAYNSAVLNVLRQYRDTVRHTSGALMWWSTYDLYRIPAIGSDINDRDHLDRIKARVDEAVAKGGILVLYGHGIQEGGGEYRADKALFREMIDYIASQPIESMTISELYEALKSQ